MHAGSSKDTEDMFLRLEKEDIIMRLDERRLPTAYKCSTVSPEELINLRRVENIIRKGRIEALHKDRIIFKDGWLVVLQNDYNISSLEVISYYSEHVLSQFYIIVTTLSFVVKFQQAQTTCTSTAPVMGWVNVRLF